MKKLLFTAMATTALSLSMTTTALSLSISQGESIKIGVLLGFTGPIESMAPDMAAGAELAMKEINTSGLLLEGSTLIPVRADSTCIDTAAATAAAERLITADKVSAIMGAGCSGTTIATLQNVALPNGIVMISPSATLAALSDICLLYTSPSPRD